MKMEVFGKGIRVGDILAMDDGLKEVLEISNGIHPGTILVSIGDGNWCHARNNAKYAIERNDHEQEGDLRRGIGVSAMYLKERNQIPVTLTVRGRHVYTLTIKRTPKKTTNPASTIGRRNNETLENARRGKSLEDER